MQPVMQLHICTKCLSTSDLDSLVPTTEIIKHSSMEIVLDGVAFSQGPFSMPFLGGPATGDGTAHASP